MSRPRSRPPARPSKPARNQRRAVKTAATEWPSPPETTLRQKLTLVTGALLADLTLAQGKSLEEASALTGFSVEQLRADGLEYAMAFVRVLDPAFMALMDATTEDEAAEAVGAIVASRAAAPAHVPGTLI
ncbi:hypothetical protein OICFNHDK_3335 [Methylobacterium bullatum]|uniref:Uncharacterized protein n=1 Tax=Methylobacterium bullatum TaxID=570505 RepID=A0AAV4ZBD0_9HYPH|nr:hypothetical protein OICFNHDK_3335 [Methylobacterium bullatum]